MNPLRIVLADDHAVVLAGVRAVLERTEPPIEIVGAAQGAEELIALLDRVPCDVLVTDFSMPSPSDHGQDGLRMLQTIRRTHPLLRVVVLTMLDNPSILRAIREMAHGLISKRSDLRELPAAVAVVGAGRSYLSPMLQAALESESGRLETALTARETEVIRLFADGYSVSEIARRLNRSVKTISHQKADAMRKLGIDNHSQLYAYARDHGLKS
jgi:two-component system, NarL family, captular synthesis response regulator RcsB